MKSVNLQYDTLVRWANETNDSSTKHLMFQVLSFFHKITKMKVKSFEFPMSITNYEKKKYLERQTLGRRVICLIGPANKRILF